MSSDEAIAVYFTPNPNSQEGILWQQVGRKAVAFFDYEIDMKRKLEEPVVLKASILTPKDLIQCGLISCKHSMLCANDSLE